MSRRMASLLPLDALAAGLSRQRSAKAACDFQHSISARPASSMRRSAMTARSRGLPAGCTGFRPVELIGVTARGTTSWCRSKAIEGRLDEAGGAIWASAHRAARAAAARRANDPARSAAGRWHRQRDAGQLLRRRPIRRCRRRRPRPGTAMAADGAAIIDVGGESTRPGARPVWEGDEIERVVPVIGGWPRRDRGLGRHAQGGGDGGGARRGRRDGQRRLGADLGSARGGSGRRGWLPVVLMHHRGDPETMQDDPRYDGVLIEVYRLARGADRRCGRGRHRARADHRRSGHRLRQEGPAQSRS